MMYVSYGWAVKCVPAAEGAPKLAVPRPGRRYDCICVLKYAYHFAVEHVVLHCIDYRINPRFTEHQLTRDFRARAGRGGRIVEPRRAAVRQPQASARARVHCHARARGWSCQLPADWTHRQGGHFALVFQNRTRLHSAIFAVADRQTTDEDCADS